MKTFDDIVTDTALEMLVRCEKRGNMFVVPVVSPIAVAKDIYPFLTETPICSLSVLVRRVELAMYRCGF
ncbi:MAG TPA: hypothetical protein VJ044_02240, partial [Candidatus Hodarchaeales archaeon]|nr:hypothetical protein [Candidatus Hodarchaeales archaeon]